MYESMSLCSNIESDSDFIGQYGMWWSANHNMIQLGKSLIYVMNKSGPDTVPRGTPEVTSVEEVESEPSTVTFCDQ